MADKYIDLKTIMESPMRQFVRIHTGETSPEDWVISGADIMRIPTADVRPVVRGRWIKKGCYAVCSNCGERKAIAWPTTVEELVNVYRLKFCNNCGADMRGLPE